MSTATAVTMLDVRAGSGAITLPLTTQIPYRVITIKDAYGAAGLSSIIINTQGSDVFENGASSITLTNAYDTTTLYAGLPGYWYTIGGSRLQGGSIGSLSTGVITNPLRLGTISTQTAIQFPGLLSNYTGTVITEQTTGAGTQELLLYKASSISDQIRLQTTGNIVFEAGASARSFPSTSALATPTLYIAGSTSNVGIGTATPAATLDVAGTGRFQTLSSFALNVSSINGIVPGGAFSGSTTSLSSATITTSTLGTNTLTTSSITSYGNVDIRGTALSNVASEYFVKPLFTSIFTPASISGLKVWLDASKLTSITSNGSAQVTVLSNLAGFGNALSNSGITPPTTGAYSINNLNTLSFTGQNSLKLPSIAYTSSDRSLFVVAQTTGNSAFYGVGSNAGSITASLYSTYYYGWERNNVTQQNLGTAIYNTPFLVTIYKTSTSNGIIVNGSNLGATPTTFTPGTYVDQIGVAGSPTGNIGPEYYGASWNLAEAIVYDGPLTPSERQTVEGYLAWKWGFQASLIITHPYYFTVPPPFGTDYIPTGSITSDANSNVSFAANNKLRLLAPVEIPTTLSTASLTVSSINGQTINQLVGIPIQSTVTGITYAIRQNTVDTVFYLNPNTPAPTYRQMSPSQTTFPQSTMTTFITRSTSNIPIAQFQTDFTVPQVIPDGAWDLNLFAYTDHARTYIYTSLFSRAGATETLIASSSNATTNVGTSPVQQYTNTLFVPQTIFTSTTGVSLVLKVFANNPINQDDNLYTYYQGGNYSHAHTTFGTVVPDTLFTSTVAGLGTAGYVSTLVNLRMISSLQGYVSSLTVDSLTIGLNNGFVDMGDVITTSLSTIQINTQTLYTNNAYIGNSSSQSAILFPGLNGGYRGTAIAEISTGVGTQELLLYKVSSISDQIRLQTTGNMVFEAGVSARGWPTITPAATPTLYIQGSSSNVGIRTATPATTLDVAGTGRFQILSTLAFNVSTINGAVPGGSAFTGSTTNLFIPYSSNNSVSTFTLQTNTASSMISFGTNTGKTQSQVYIGDLFNQLNLSTNISPVVLIDSVFPTNSITVSTFRSSGIFIVPSNVSFINVHLWGSGGSNSGSVAGGGGAFLTGFLPVTPGQRLHVTVNQAGGRGAGGYANVHGGGFAGIYDSISTVTNVLAVAAGGGGGGGYSDRGGGGGGVFVGKTFGYTAGTQTTPGNFGTAYKLKGGDGADNGYGAGPGGGGGWWGGSGASGDSVGILSGAGGSSYFSNLINWSGEDGANGHVGGLAGGKWSPYYANNYGDSNTIGAAVIAWAPSLRQTNLLELRDVTQGRMFAVNRNLNMGIGVSSVGNNYTVEVNGNAYISSLVTLNTLTSNMTIPLSNINPLTLTSTQSIFAMNTISSGAQLAFGTTQAYGLFGKYSQVYMGDVKQIQGNFTNSDPVLRIDQDFPLTPSSNVSIISFSTTVNTYTVPAGMTMAKAYLWGQGGKGWGGTTSNGGGGAFISGTFSVIPGEQLAVAVNYGAGGGFGANGGGLTGIFRSTIAQSNTIAIAAGGGGGGSFVTTVGGFGGVVAGSSGSYRGPNVGLGATQTAAGAGAGEGASSGGALQGGGGGAGGGAGYFGGGGGGNNSVDQVGGGGGSSFVGGLFPGSIVAENGNLGTPPGIGPPPGLGLGGGKFAPFYFGTNGDGGGSGWGVIVFARAFRQTNLLELRGPTSRNLVAVDSQMNMGVNVSSVTSSITLDVGGIGRFITLSSFSLNVSSINGVVPGGTFNGSTLGISTSIVGTSTLNTVFLSSVQGYVSSFRTDSLTVGGTSGFVNIQDLITQTTSTGQFVAGSGFISSLQINSLSFGPSGYVIVGDVIANSLSTTRLNTQSFYTNNAYIGNVSSQSAILFPGIDRNYRGTAVAEQTTGVGTQELLLYKVSSTTDQIRLQTTGNIVFEAGAAARSWPSTTQLATPTLYIAGSSSNVGVGTASPATTLDVVGTGRFQTLSTLSFNVSSINGAAPGGTFNGSTTSLSSAVINVSSLSSAYITSAQGYISSLTVDYLAIGSNLGFINMGDIITTSHSSLQINTGTLTASGPVQAQSVSTLQTVTSSIGIGTATPSYQLDVAGTARAQRVIAQPSGTTPATSVSPLAVINGNAYLSFSPQIEFQYNSGGYKHFMGSRHYGDIVGNFGNAIDFWLYSAASGGSTASTAPNAGNVNTLSVTAGGVGIFNNSPAYALDVIGIINTQTSVRAPVLSTLALNVSSINGTVQWQQSFLTSTVGGLATSGYISTTQLTSTTANLIARIGAGGLAASPYAVQGSLSTNQSMLSGNDTTFGFTTTGSYNNNSNIDPQSWWNHATSQLRPTISGYYLVNLAVWWATSTGNQQNNIQIRKNGNQIAIHQNPGMTYAGSGQSHTMSALVQMNGTTDYITFSGYSGNGVTTTQQNGTYFNAILTTTATFTGSTFLISTTSVQSQTLSSLNLQVSTINGLPPGTGSGTSFIGSTTFLSASQVLVSSQTNYNLSSVLGFISSLQVDELQIGNGYGILGFGDTQMSSVSSIAVVANLGQFMTMSTLAINASSITGVVVGATFTGTLGTVSSLTALRYYGLTGSYANTAIAEVSTGTGTQELLLYKVSSIADQVRVQTTGNVIFEAGVGARSWPTAPRATVPTFYIAGSNSNVGVGTSNPVTTLDVAGTGRFQTLSSLNITAGSINYSVAFV